VLGRHDAQAGRAIIIRHTVPKPSRRWWPHALVAATVLAVYANSLTGPFIFDDRATIIDNRTIEDLASTNVFSPPHETSVAGRPVANLSFALNYAFGEREVAGYHAVNIAIHVLCALVLFGIVRRTFAGSKDPAYITAASKDPAYSTAASKDPAYRTARSRDAVYVALAVALVWAVHPLNTEAVDYLTQRTESLMALFYLSTLYCAIRAVPGSSNRRLWTGASIAACALGMATKESMVTAPLVVALYDRVFLFPSIREAWRRRAWLYAGLAATWALLAALVWSGPRNLSAGFTTYDASVLTYLWNQAAMIVRYLRLSIWPRDLVLYYGWPQPLSPRDVLPQLVVVTSLLAVTAWALWRKPRAGFLGACFFLTLAPTSSIVPIATEVGAERRMYVPLVAVVVLAVLAFRAIVAAPRLRAAALVVVTLLLGAGTLARNAEYRSSLRLAETTAERWPTAAAHSMLGTELAAAGRLPEAEQHLRQAAPDYPPARYYLGTVLAAQNRPVEAIDHFRSFIAGQPSGLDQVRLAHRELAGALVKSGREDDAAVEYRAVLAADPADTVALVQVAQILLRHQRFDEAIVVLKQLTTVRPSDPWAFGGLGVAFASTGRLDEAVDAFQRQVAFDPQNERARQNLARAQAMRAR
jgi:Flp pilus assembly protein TadD